jgi:branched-chain amino acid transport system permease protein
METIWQGVFNGLMMGGIYVLVALGLTIIFSIMGIVQFAHGEIYMLGAYCVYYVSVVRGMNVLVAFILSALTLGLGGIILERFLFRRFRGQIEPSIIIAIALILLLQTTAVVGFGTQSKWIPKIIPGVLTVWSVRLAWDRVLAVLIGISLMFLLFLFIQWTKAGQAMVAISQDPDAAALQGVNVNRISSLSMAIGCALAAIAGGLMGAIFQADPFMGGFAMAKGIAVIVLGGLGSIPGAVMGGFILGLLDGLIPLVASTTVATAIGFILIIFILIIKPRGLLGHA